MSEPSRPSSPVARRDFLKGSTAAIVGGALASQLAIARSAHAAGDDEIKIALIGCGGRGTGAANQALRTAGKVKLPILIQQGGDDRIASPPATRAVFEALASPDRTYREYPGLFHEIYFEIERKGPIGDLTQWLSAHA